MSERKNVVTPAGMCDSNAIIESDATILLTPASVKHREKVRKTIVPIIRSISTSLFQNSIITTFSLDTKEVALQPEIQLLTKVGSY